MKNILVDIEICLNLPKIWRRNGGKTHQLIDDVYMTGPCLWCFINGHMVALSAPVTITCFFSHDLIYLKSVDHSANKQTNKQDQKQTVHCSEDGEAKYSMYLKVWLSRMTLLCCRPAAFWACVQVSGNLVSRHTHTPSKQDRTGQDRPTYTSNNHTWLTGFTVYPPFNSSIL